MFPQVNGTQMAAGCNDGTVIAWSYPKGEILFQMKGHKELVNRIKWNPFREDVFATFCYVRIVANYFYITCSASSYLDEFPTWKSCQKIVEEDWNWFNYSVNFSLLSFSFFISQSSGRKEISVVEYGSERRRHKGKSILQITKCGNQRCRVDFCKSNGSWLEKLLSWYLANQRGQWKSQDSSCQTIQTRRMSTLSRNFADITIVKTAYILIELKKFVKGIEWNETTKYLASCSEGRIKV